MQEKEFGEMAKSLLAIAEELTKIVGTLRLIAGSLTKIAEAEPKSRWQTRNQWD